MNTHPNYSIAVQNLQTYLRRLSYACPEIPPPPVDGIFDSATECSLRAFQELNGLEPTGVADARTWDLLYREYLRVVSESPPHPESSAIPPFFPVFPGEASLEVVLIQNLLDELTVIYEFPTVPVATGIYDEATANNIRYIQSASLLEPTGIVNVPTWNILLRNFSNYAR